MKKISNLQKLGLIVSLVFSITCSTIVQADVVKISSKPLVDSTVSDVLPNLMFVLDNSGSMGQDYTPDWANSSNVNLRKNSVYNTQYYDPSIRYTPAVNFGGNSRGDQLSPWTSVRNDNYNIQTTASSNLVGNAEYYYFVAGEHCTTQALTTCIASNVPTASHPFPAPIRWCNSGPAATTTLPAMPLAGTCRAINEGAFTNLRRPSSTATITFAGNSNTRVSSITVAGLEIMANQTVQENNSNNMAANVIAQINLCTNAISGNCQTVGYSATRSGSVVTITSPYGDIVVPQLPVVTRTGSMTATPTAFVSRRPGRMFYVNIVSGVNSYPVPGSLLKSAERTDCAGATCTYAQEMTNYANWWTYYRTRMQSMKTSASQAFKAIDNRYRVGFITINNPAGNYLPIGKYEAGNGQQKNNWYNRLFATNPSGGTPLRASLATVGRIYAGRRPVGSADPVEYACQPNFTLLTTDGYWNGAGGTDVNNGNIGNLDGPGTDRPMFEGSTASSGSLSDVSKYYYDTDIRRSDFGNCSGALGQNVCGEGVGNESFLKQNMTTLTLGLGIDGTLFFDNDYETQTTGDFADLRAGTKNWPVPVQDTPSAIDDLWHAAVNGNGQYFSARNPRELSESLRRALSNIQSKSGTGSASSASSLQPTAGDNFEYTASYETVKWIGNIESRTVDLLTLETSQAAGWCAEDVASQSCTSPAQLVTEDVNGSASFFCKTDNSNPATCGGLGGDLTGNVCRVQVAKGCSGTMKTKVAANSDTRSIFMNKGGALAPFTWGNLSASQQLFYSASFLANNLSQWPDYTSGTNSQQTKAVGANFINYLRGQTGFEDRSSNLVDNRLYRYRQATLGDITDSQPAYMRDPRFKYVDSGYDAFKTSQSSRSPTVYVGANDGMLHAFNAINGQERWAFVPTPAISKMWKLADKDYATNHVNLVNGDPVIGEIFDGSWKTILVAGLAGGGRGYYALDITNPDAPQLLWEKTAADLPNLGHTFGSPIITKLNNGAWAVVLTSGYNNGTFDNNGITPNSPSGNGGGSLYVLTAGSGNLLRTYTTGAGNANTPSGLSPVSGFVDDVLRNNTSAFVLGGDLLGNLWKFDINTNVAPVLLATLRGPSGVAQAITAKPELGVINRNKVAFIGTGKYLEPLDLNVTGAPRESLYAVKVDGVTPLGNPRGAMIAQQISGSGESRTVSSFPVDFGASLGWFADFPETGERVNIDPLLVGGVLVVPTIVPASTTCSPGGFGYLNFFNYLTGGALLPGGVISERTNTPIVGIGVSYNKDGKGVIKFNTSDNQTSRVSNRSRDLNIGAGKTRTTILRQNDGGTFGRKYIWRELVPNQ